MSLLVAAACIPLWLGGCGEGIPEVALGSTADASPSSGVERRTDGKEQLDLSAVPNVLRVRSASGKAVVDHPLQFGRPFVAGEIRRCPQVLVDGVPAPAQVDVKTRHPDGSVRFALVSAVLPSVPASGSLSISFSDTECQAQAPLATAEMLSPRFDFDARIALNGGAAGTASARDMLSRGHYTLWTSGQVVTTAVIADHKTKSFDIGVDAHKSLRPVFEVQFWPTIAKTRVRVILEATDTEKVQNQNYDVGVFTGASAPKQVMSASGVKHNYMSRWTRVFWIGGAPEGVDVDYGLAYLARTRALPNYDPSIQLGQASKNATLNAWASAPRGLYGKGLWQTDMTVSGGRPDLGPHPKWMVAWLYDGSAALKDVALGQADLAAAWPMHLREGNTGKFADRARKLPALGEPVSGYARPTLTYASLGYNYTRTADRVNLVGERSGNGWVADNAHQPQPFFIPYLLTGEHFYNEQLQFWAGYSLLDNAWGLYGEYCYSKNATPEYLGIGGQLRGVAWGFRMISEAAWAATDADQGARTWLRDAVEDTITRFEGSRGIVRDGNASRLDWQWAKGKGDCSAGQVANNPLRFWHEGNSAYGSTASVARYEATWQYAFLMYSLNRAYELGLPAGSLREWFAPFFVGAATHGGLTGYHLADYKIPVIDAQTGTFYPTWESLHAEYTGYEGHKAWTPNSTANSNSVNSLEQGYGTVALTALASTAGLPGSAAAWEGFAAPHYAVWGWSADPKWAILPRGARAMLPPLASVPDAVPGTMTPSEKPAAPAQPQPSTPSVPPVDGSNASDPGPVATGAPPPPPAGPLPAWLASAKVFEWREIPSTRLDETEVWKNYKAAPGTLGKYGILAYSGGTVKTKRSEFFISGGGHQDYAGNEVFSIVLNTDAPRWVRRNNPSTALADNQPYYPDGRPAGRHSYWAIQYIDRKDRLMFFGMAPWGVKPGYYGTVDGFDLATNDYEPAGTYASQEGIGGPDGVGRDAQENIYIHSGRNGNLYKWTLATGTWENLGYRGAYQHNTPFAVDTKRNRMFRPPSGSSGAAYYDLNKGGVLTPLTLTGPAAQASVGPVQVVYDSANDVFWLWKRNDATLYRIDAETFHATVQPVQGTLPRVAYKDARHNIYGRFNYVPELRGLVFMLDASGNIFFIRTADLH